MAKHDEFYSPSSRGQHSEDAFSLATVEEEETKWALSEGLRSGLKISFLWVGYVILGSVTFVYLEHTTTITASSRDHQTWAKFKEVASGGGALGELLKLRQHLVKLCEHPVINATFGMLEAECGETQQDSGDRVPHQQVLVGEWWRVVEADCGESLRLVDHVTSTHMIALADAVYFIMTLVTTIGYGHIYPTTANSRLFCILYSLVGVPLTCMLLANSSEMLSKRMLLLYTTARKRYVRHPKTLLYGITWIYLSLGFIVFMFLPSLALSELEGWDYEEAFYYTFTTLSTIGFGEYVAGYKEDQAHKGLYKMVVVAWIMAALGYWFLLLNFLQKALQSNVPQQIKKSFTQKALQSNVPQQIKRTFTVSKRLTKQAEFFSHLARMGERKSRHVEGDHGVVALAAAVAGVLLWEPPSLVRKPLCKKFPKSDDSDTESTTTDITETHGKRMTLSDLLEVHVVLRSDTVPAIRSFVKQAGTSVESRSLHDLLTAEEGQGLAVAQPQEVTLPLREVLHLVSLVAQVEEQMNATESDNLLGDQGSACIFCHSGHHRINLTRLMTLSQDSCQEETDQEDTDTGE